MADSVLAGLALVLLGILAFPSSGDAEEFEVTSCYSGTFNAFQGSQDLKAVFDWADNGIYRSAHNQFNNATRRCAGIQRGLGATREGYYFCKAVDADGDIIIFGGPYTGLKTKSPFLEGTGKWKGITRDVESERITSASRPAMPSTYQECSQLKGKFEARK